MSSMAHEAHEDEVDALELILDGALAPRHGQRDDDGFKGRKVVNEVLDRTTVHTIYEMIKSGTLLRVNGAVNAGKESVVFWATGGDGADVALKVYLVSTSNFKSRAAYIEGDPRFKRVRGGTRNMVYTWAQKEFKNLSGAHAAGIRVPAPITADKNVLAMEFIGEGGVSAPTLNNVRATYAEYKDAIAAIESLYCEASLVHADLSGYNILRSQQGTVIFDFGSAVNTRHPRSLEFLKRDIGNITDFFVRHGHEVENPKDILRRVTR